jgi:hypothetical protein
MNKAIAIALLAAGIALLVMGANSNDSIGSHLSRFFTGSPTDKTVWMLVGGIVATAFGLFSLLLGYSKR